MRVVGYRALWGSAEAGVILASMATGGLLEEVTFE